MISAALDSLEGRNKPVEKGLLSSRSEWEVQVSHNSQRGGGHGKTASDTTVHTYGVDIGRLVAIETCCYGDRLLTRVLWTPIKLLHTFLSFYMQQVHVVMQMDQPAAAKSWLDSHRLPRIHVVMGTLYYYYVQLKHTIVVASFITLQACMVWHQELLPLPCGLFLLPPHSLESPFIWRYLRMAVMYVYVHRALYSARHTHIIYLSTPMTSRIDCTAAWLSGSECKDKQ